MASSTGVLCGAGFEGPAEALFLQKKVLAIPMKGQYEQHCNAAGLQQLGVPVINQLSKKYYKDIAGWLESEQHIHTDFPDQTAFIIKQLIQQHALKITPEAAGTTGTNNQPDLSAAH